MAEDAEIMTELNKITETIIGSAIAVHQELGPGLLESAYEACLVYELLQCGLLINFNVKVLKQGIKRLVNNLTEQV